MMTYRKPKQVEIIYFSGTGSTKEVAGTFAKSFINKGISIQSHEISKNNKYEPYKSDLLLILYPVYALNAPEPVYDFIDELPYRKGKPAVVISVSGGGEVSPNTASRVHCIRRLQGRGYRVVYEKMIVMPSNVLVATPEDLIGPLLLTLPNKIEHIVNDLMAGKVRRTKPHFIDLFLSRLGELEKSPFGAKLFGKQIKAASNCNGCGLCERSCSMGNIKLVNGKPVFGSNCTLCLRCIYGCPKKALSPKYFKFFILKNGYSMSKFKEGINSKPSNRKIAKGNLAMSGVVKYLKEED